MSDVWLTPPDVLKAVGPFDLDPCASDFQAWRPWETAKECYTHGGLERPWFGSVWLNPPYSDVEAWVKRLADHGQGVALTFARTSAPWFRRQVLRRCAGLFFIEHHLYFHHANGARAKGNGGAPSVLSAFGGEALERLARADLPGELWIAAPMIVRRGDGTPVGTWREAVLEAAAGRKLHIRDLYAAAEGTRKVAAAKAKGENWRAQLRRTLQRHFEQCEFAVWRPA